MKLLDKYLIRKFIFNLIFGISAVIIIFLVVDLIETSRARLLDSGVRDIEEVRNYGRPLLMHSDEVAKDSLELKQFLRHNLYQHYRVLRMSKKAERVIGKMFHAFMDDFS